MAQLFGGDIRSITHTLTKCRWYELFLKNPCFSWQGSTDHLALGFIKFHNPTQMAEYHGALCILLVHGRLEKAHQHRRNQNSAPASTPPDSINSVAALTAVMTRTGWIYGTPQTPNRVCWVAYPQLYTGLCCFLVGHWSLILGFITFWHGSFSWKGAILIFHKFQSP